MGRRKGAFKAEKRRKELKRLAKQTAKTKRRLAKTEEAVGTADESPAPMTAEGTAEEGTAGEEAEEAPVSEEE